VFKSEEGCRKREVGDFRVCL